MDWTLCATNLAASLRDLPERTFVIVKWTQGTVYVQFHQDEQALFAEAVGDDVAPPQSRLSVEGVDRMRAEGWEPPDFGAGGNTNWRREVVWPARSAAYRELAEACVISLQLRGVDTPDDLRYTAWRDPQPMLPGVTYADGELDPGDRELRMDGLGLRHGGS